MLHFGYDNCCCMSKGTIGDDCRQQEMTATYDTTLLIEMEALLMVAEAGTTTTVVAIRTLTVDGSTNSAKTVITIGEAVAAAKPKIELEGS